MKYLISFSVAVSLIMVLNGVAKATDFDHVGLVDVIEALALAEDTQLDFGTVSANLGTITLDTADSITDPSGISVVGPFTSGDFTITGQSGNTVQVVVSAGSMPSGLDLKNFTTSPADLTALTLTSGTASFTIGADLEVLAGVSTGTDQSLNFTIAVTYN